MVKNSVTGMIADSPMHTEDRIPACVADTVELPVGGDKVDMAAKLTPRSIEAIMRGENIEQPVVQFVGYRRVPIECTTRDFYCMEIWDGTVSSYFFWLDDRLNYLITSGELQEKSIIRLDQYRGSDSRVFNKSINILELTILVKGEVVGDITATSGINERNDGVERVPNTVTLRQFSITGEIPDLTPGCIKAMMRGENIEKPVVELLNYKRFAHQFSRGGVYKLIISDGTFMCTSVMLSVYLNDLIISGELQIDCIIRLDRYQCIEPYGEKTKLLLIEELTILVEVEENEQEMITDSSMNNEEIHSVQPISNTLKKQVFMAAKLTQGCIKAIARGESIEQPVIELLNYRRIISEKTKRENYHLLIWDGTCVAFTVLAHKLNYLVSSGELQENSIIRLDKYHCSELCAGLIKKLIVIWELTILVKGEVMSEMRAFPGSNESIDSVQQIFNTSMVVS